MTAAAISAVLGGRKVLKRKVETEWDLQAITRDGLPVGTLTTLAAELELERKTLAKVVGISDRTLSRRLSSQSNLSPEESDRMLRLARVFAKAEDTFGTMEQAARWMRSPILALGDETPLDQLDTDAGAKLVEEVLYRIDYGIFS